MQKPEILDKLLDHWNGGQAQPSELAGTLDMDSAYALQVDLLHRRRANGAVHTGWKIGQTNAAIRKERGEDQPAPGYLLQTRAVPDGGSLPLRGQGQWVLEPELALIIGAEIRGPGVTPDTVAQSVASTAPSFELILLRSGWPDRALSRAVNGTNAGYVLGPSRPGCPSAAELDDLRVKLWCDGDMMADLRGGDAVDNPLASTAWLANKLADLGEALLPGQIILTGTFTGIHPLEPHQTWRTQVGDDEVTLTTAVDTVP